MNDITTTTDTAKHPDLYNYFDYTENRSHISFVELFNVHLNNILAGNLYCKKKVHPGFKYDTVDEFRRHLGTMEELKPVWERAIAAAKIGLEGLLSLFLVQAMQNNPPQNLAGIDVIDFIDGIVKIHAVPKGTRLMVLCDPVASHVLKKRVNEFSHVFKIGEESLITLVNSRNPQQSGKITMLIGFEEPEAVELPPYGEDMKELKNMDDFLMTVYHRKAALVSTIVGYSFGERYAASVAA